ncbi:MAG: class I SAM-dependent methyltransferase [Roseobacter sp.]
MGDEKKPELSAAYGLTSPDDNRALYRDWAETYENDFAKAMDFALPQTVAAAFLAAGGLGPVLDVGAGTGLAGVALRAQSDAVVDALDISPEMLAVSARKNIYRHLVAADITKPLPLRSGQYNGVISSGTFTHGHLGPEPLDALLAVTASGALFVLSIKVEHFESKGFAQAFDALGGRISGLHLDRRPIYGTDAPKDRAGDTCFIAHFRKS